VLQVRALVPLDAMDVMCASPLLKARITRRGEDSSRFDIEVIPSTQLPVGQVESEIVLTPHCSGKDHLPKQRIPVRGRVVPDVQVFPESILLGCHSVGRRLEEAVTLHSLTDKPVVVKRVAAPEGVEVEPIKTKNAPAGIHYRIRQTISEGGSHSSRVRFVIAPTPGGGEQEAVVEMIWHGILDGARLRTDRDKAR
jgi:hypothetical protein